MPGDKTPKKIGPFILHSKLGEGTFATVYLGIHLQTNEQVAIKILNKHQIFEQITKTRIEREIKILKILRHPNIIHLYSVIQTTDHIFLVMEYANGHELFEYINHKHKLSELEACKFYQQIISGIEYLSKLKITHRDLKPENLLLDAKKQNLKICDFGLSNSYSNGNIYLNSACGSPCYAAPEMIQGKKYIGTRIDIWSSGIVLYAMLCGYLPFEENNNDLLYRKIIKGELIFPNHLSDLARDFLLKILNVSPEKRYNIEQIKKHPWFNLLNKTHRLFEGLIISKVLIPIDEDIVFQMETLGFKREEIKKQISDNKHNNLTTTYYLLLNKKIHNGISSVSDLRSKEFNEYLSKDEHYIISKGKENRNIKQLSKKSINDISTHNSTKRIKSNLVYTVNDNSNTTESTVLSSMKMLINTTNISSKKKANSTSKGNKNFSKEHCISFNNVIKGKLNKKGKQHSTSVSKSKNTSNKKIIKELIPTKHQGKPIMKIPMKISKEKTTNKVCITVSSTAQTKDNKHLQSSKILYHKANINLQSIHYTNPKLISTNLHTQHNKSISNQTYINDIDTNIQTLFTKKINKKLFDKTIKTNITTIINNISNISNKKYSPKKNISYKQFNTSVSPLKPSKLKTKINYKTGVNSPKSSAYAKLSLSRKELYDIIFNNKNKKEKVKNISPYINKISRTKKEKKTEKGNDVPFRRRKIFNTSINYESSNVNSFNASLSYSLNTSISRQHKNNYSNTISNVSIFIDDFTKNKKDIEKAYIVKKSKNKKFMTINEEVLPKRNKTPNIRKRTNMTVDVMMDLNNYLIKK